MDGVELQAWVAWFEIKEEDRRAQALDAKGKSNLMRLMRK